MKEKTLLTMRDLKWSDWTMDDFIAYIKDAESIKVTNYKQKCQIRIVTKRLILTPVFKLDFEGLKAEVPDLGEALEAKGYEFHQVEGKRE